jgi:TRAP transporter TAXI family solute receptor
MRITALVLASILVAGPYAGGLAQTAPERPQELVNQGTVGIISGGVTGTYVRIAADLAAALDDGYQLRVLPVVGKGSVRNVEDLLYLRGIDIAIVQSDVLDFYKKTNALPGIERHLTYVAKLYDEEVHVLAREGITSVDDLAGKKVNFGPQGSGTFMTSDIVFDQLGLEVDVQTDPEPKALERLKAGEIDAMVFVVGQPWPLISQIAPEDGLHFLDLPAERIAGAYLPTELTASSYPGIVPETDAVDTIAVGAVMAAYDWPAGHDRRTKVEHFVETFEAKFDDLKSAPYHPKWQEVDLTAEVPGWRRFETSP